MKFNTRRAGAKRRLKKLLAKGWMISGGGNADKVALVNGVYEVFRTDYWLTLSKTPKIWSNKEQIEPELRKFGWTYSEKINPDIFMWDTKTNTMVPIDINAKTT